MLQLQHWRLVITKSTTPDQLLACLELEIKKVEGHFRIFEDE